MICSGTGRGMITRVSVPQFRPKNFDAKCSCTCRAGTGSFISKCDWFSGDSYRDSISLILQNAVILMLLPPRLLLLPFLPKRQGRIGNAIVAFKKYMTEVLNEEKNLVLQRKPWARNLMGSFIRRGGVANNVAARLRGVNNWWNLWQYVYFQFRWRWNYCKHVVIRYSLVCRLSEMAEICCWRNAACLKGWKKWEVELWECLSAA